MTTIYFNAFYDDKKNIFIESRGLSNYEDALEDAGEQDRLHYAFTLEVDLEGETKRIDLSSKIFDYRFPANPEYERLTGHEMGVCGGRI